MNNALVRLCVLIEKIIYIYISEVVLHDIIYRDVTYINTITVFLIDLV